MRLYERAYVRACVYAFCLCFGGTNIYTIGGEDDSEIKNECETKIHTNGVKKEIIFVMFDHKSHATCTLLYVCIRKIFLFESQ